MGKVSRRLYVKHAHPGQQLSNDCLQGLVLRHVLKAELHMLAYVIYCIVCKLKKYLDNSKPS